MKKLLVFYIFIPLLVSCEFTSFYKEVSVSIEDVHPFEEICQKELWYLVYWNNNKGEIKYLHLPIGVKTFKLKVPKNINTYICASLLGLYNPLGGVICPGSQRNLCLSFEQGYLVDFLISLNHQNYEAINIINYKSLYSMLKSKKNFYSFDKLTLARALMNGTLKFSYSYKEPLIRIDLKQVPIGYWVSDLPSLGVICILNYNDLKSISLGEGKYNFFNKEENYILTIIVDNRNKKYYINLKECPEIMKKKT